MGVAADLRRAQTLGCFRLVEGKTNRWVSEGSRQGPCGHCAVSPARDHQPLTLTERLRLFEALPNVLLPVLPLFRASPFLDLYLIVHAIHHPSTLARTFKRRPLLSSPPAPLTDRSPPSPSLSLSRTPANFKGRTLGHLLHAAQSSSVVAPPSELSVHPTHSSLPSTTGLVGLVGLAHSPLRLSAAVFFITRHHDLGAHPASLRAHHQ